MGISRTQPGCRTRGSMGAEGVGWRLALEPQPTDLPEYRLQSLNLLEMGITSNNFQVVLYRRRCNPDVVLR